MPRGKTRRQIRRAKRGWSFSSSSPRPQSNLRHNSSPRHIENHMPFHKTSSNHSAWRTVSSKHSNYSNGQSVSRGRGIKRSIKRSIKTRKSRK